MRQNKKKMCPDCGSNEFITEPNQYDILIFSNNGFENQATKQIEEYKVYCRECSKEVDLLKSINKIVLKK